MKTASKRQGIGTGPQPAIIGAISAACPVILVLAFPAAYLCGKVRVAGFQSGVKPIRNTDFALG
ncbi:MAG: hypothetical protein ACRECY_05080, partial [Phyllobacterium sp.]